MAATKAKAPGRTGAPHSKDFNRHQCSRRERGAQHPLRDLVEAAATARRSVPPEDRMSIVENATPFATAVLVRAEGMVGRRVRRGAAWRQARIVAARVAVDFELTRRGMAEPTPLSASPTAVENQAHSLVRFFLDNLDLDDLDTLVVQLAAVLVVLVSLTYSTTPATCRGSARRRRRRRAAAMCSRARAARKGAGSHARPRTPSRVG